MGKPAAFGRPAAARACALVFVWLFVGAAGCGSDGGAAADTAAPPVDGGVDAVVPLPDPDVLSDAPADPPEDVAGPSRADLTNLPDLAQDIEAARDARADVYRGYLGGDRPAPVHLPADYHPDREWPLILLLHGQGVTGFVQDIYLGLSARTTAFGFIEIVPDGLADADGERYWNATWCCDPDGANPDDFGYLLGLIDEAAGHFRVDRRRVYVVGHSNGGLMAYRLACDAAETVAAMVSIAGNGYREATDCAPAAPVAVLQVHGTEDRNVPYESTERLPGAEEMVARWVARNDCPGPREDDLARDYDLSVAGDETHPSRWTGCADDTTVELWRMQGSGHSPGFLPAFGDAMVAWLLDHARPPADAARE